MNEDGTTNPDRSFLKKSVVNGLPVWRSGPKNCTHSGYPATTASTQAAVPRPPASARIRPGTSRGRLAAMTISSRTAASPVSNRISSVMNSCAAASRPSQRPPRTALVRPVASRSTASTISGGNTANCRS